MNVGGVRRRHHAPLHRGNAAFREQHDDIDLIAAAECFNRCAAGIARGCDHDGPAFAACGQHMIHQPCQQLHGHVFERERRAVEQLKCKGIGAKLGKRCDRRMAEAAVSLARHAREVGFGDGIGSEQPDHLYGDFGIGPAGKAGDCLRLEPRPDLRHIEAAVAGKASEQYFGKADRWGFAPGGEVSQNQQLPGPARTRGRCKSLIFQDVRCERPMAPRPGPGHTNRKAGSFTRNAKRPRAVALKYYYELLRLDFSAHAANDAASTSAKPYQVRAYPRCSLRSRTTSFPGFGRPPGGTGDSCST